MNDDKAVLGDLKSMFVHGIEQNQQNSKDVSTT